MTLYFIFLHGRPAVGEGLDKPILTHIQIHLWHIHLTPSPDLPSSTYPNPWIIRVCTGDVGLLSVTLLAAVVVSEPKALHLHGLVESQTPVVPAQPGEELPHRTPKLRTKLRARPLLLALQRVNAERRARNWTSSPAGGLGTGHCSGWYGCGGVALQLLAAAAWLLAVLLLLGAAVAAAPGQTAGVATVDGRRAIAATGENFICTTLD